MPTLEKDRLVFRFPEIEGDASFSIDFQRTLRIPDSDETYSLPPGLGSFPVRHVEDFSDKLPEATAARGGVILPMWQAEALWLNFSSWGPHWDLDFPVAIKVAAGKVNAVTGEAWRSGLHRGPQDYMVSPEQPWLDGFAVEKGVIRQFVAMPLGDGYSVEEQLTGEAEWGGLQIAVVPLKASVWQAKRSEWEARRRERENERRRLRDDDYIMQSVSSASSYPVCKSMGLGAGGRMRQGIYPDRFTLSDWDVAAADRVFVTLLHAKDWKSVTGDAAPNEPPTAKEYSDAGLPWFDFYGNDQAALLGSEKLAGVKSVATLFNEKTGATLTNSHDIETGKPRRLGARNRKPRAVYSEGLWDS